MSTAMIVQAQVPCCNHPAATHHLELLVGDLHEPLLVVYVVLCTGQDFMVGPPVMSAGRHPVGPEARQNQHNGDCNVPHAPQLMF